MKKFRIVALMMCFVAVSFAMTSCQKAEDLIVGKWKCIGVTGSGSDVNTYVGINAIWEFKADNTVVMNGITGTYSIADDVLTIGWSAYGVTVDNSMDIKKLTKSTMILADREDMNNNATFEKL